MASRTSLAGRQAGRQANGTTSYFPASLNNKHTQSVQAGFSFHPEERSKTHRTLPGLNVKLALSAEVQCGDVE